MDLNGVGRWIGGEIMIIDHVFGASELRDRLLGPSKWREFCNWLSELDIQRLCYRDLI